MQDLIIKYISGEITPEERKELFSRAERDASCREELLAAITLRSLSDWLPHEEDIPASIEKLMDFKRTRREKKRSMPVRHWMGYAAAVCLAVLSTWAVMNSSHPSSAVYDDTAVYQEFSTPAGQRAQVKLYDGTTVWLNASSTLRYPNRFDVKERRVELDGEAYFEVSKDERRPFIVVTEKMNVKVLGTKFNVFAYRGQDVFSALLVEGSVEVSDAHESAGTMRLEPYEEAVREEGRFVRRQVRNTDFLLWKDGIYAFDDATLGDIVRKLELYYDVTISVENAALESYRFSGKFRQRDGVENVLRTLQKVRPFSYLRDDKQNNITIR